MGLALAMGEGGDVADGTAGVGSPEDGLPTGDREEEGTFVGGSTARSGGAPVGAGENRFLTFLANTPLFMPSLQTVSSSRIRPQAANSLSSRPEKGPSLRSSLP